jgi:hypothetical protein
MKKFQETFDTFVDNVRRENSFGTIDSADGVTMRTTIGVDPDGGYGGWYETYDAISGGAHFHAEGILEIDFPEEGQPTLVGYDGCYDLPDYIIRKLEEHGVKNDL